MALRAKKLNMAGCSGKKDMRGERKFNIRSGFSFPFTSALISTFEKMDKFGCFFTVLFYSFSIRDKGKIHLKMSFLLSFTHLCVTPNQKVEIFEELLRNYCQIMSCQAPNKNKRVVVDMICMLYSV